MDEREQDPAALLATSLLSSEVSKFANLSDNSDNAGGKPFAPAKITVNPESPKHKRILRRKVPKVPVVASVNRRKRTSTRSETDAELTSDEIDEKSLPPHQHLGPSQSSKKAFKKRGQQCAKAKNDALTQKKKSPMYVQLDEKDNN